MGYDRDDSFPFDIEPNGNPFGSKSKGKLSPRSYPIQFERKSNTSFLSVHWKSAAAYDNAHTSKVNRIFGHFCVPTYTQRNID